MASKGTETKLIESCFDTLKFERAYIDGDGYPVAIVGGTECCIATRDLLLNAGLANCNPVDGETRENWPIYCDITIDGEWQRWWGLTAQPEVVAAAKHFRALQDAGEVQPWMPL